MQKSLNQLAQEIHDVAKEKGWYEDNRSFGDIIALIHSEVSETLEEYRNGHAPSVIHFAKVDPTDEEEYWAEYWAGQGDGYWAEYWAGQGHKPEGIPIELADILIRILDLCAKENIDIDTALRVKMVFNQTRPYRHGGKVI